MTSKRDLRNLKYMLFFSDLVQALNTEYNHGQAQDDAHFEDMLLVMTSRHAFLFSKVYSEMGMVLDLDSEVTRVLDSDRSQLLAFEVETKVQKKSVKDLIVIRTEKKGQLLDYLRLPS